MMAELIRLIISLTGNFLLLSSLTLVFGLLLRIRRHVNPLLYSIIAGVYFAGICAVSQLSAVELKAGIVLDAQIVIVGLAMNFAGPFTGYFTAAAAVLIRYYLGGNAMLLGMALVPAFAALFHYHLRSPRFGKFNDKQRLLLMGTLAAVMNSLSLLLHTPRIGGGTVAMGIISMFLVFPPATLMIGVFLRLPLKNRQLARELKISEERFSHLFQYAPVALWEEDYSKAAEFVWTDPYFKPDTWWEHTSESVPEYVSRIRIIAVNQRAILLSAAASLEDLLQNLDKTFLPDTYKSFITEINSIREHQTSCSTTSHIQNLKGEELFVRIHWNVIPGHEEEYGRVIVSIVDLTEVTKQAMRLEESLVQQEMLIKEIHHRVRNSLSVAYSILGLQKEKLDDPGHRRFITDTQNRIQTISLIHTKLYQNKTILAIDIGGYLDDLVRFLSRQEYGQLKGISLDIEDMYMHIDQVLPLGLLLCELICGSIQSSVHEGDAFIGLKSEESILKFRYTYRYLAEKETGSVLGNGSLREMLVQNLLRQVKARDHRIENTPGDFRLTIEMPLLEVAWLQQE